MRYSKCRYVWRLCHAVVLPHCLQGGDGTDRAIDIPALMISASSGARLKKRVRDHMVIDATGAPTPLLTVQGEVVTRPAPPLPPAPAPGMDMNAAPRQGIHAMSHVSQHLFFFAPVLIFGCS